MFLQTKLVNVALLASALLCASSLTAALKTSGHIRPTAQHLRATSSRTPSRTLGHRSTASAVVSTRRGHGKARIAVVSKPKFRGQQSIDADRTIEIQQALIREHYLDGEASGQWDQATRDALTRFQSDNHWQTKILPDSRALIKLGLGPSQQNLLNPESAAIAIPYKPGLEKAAPAGSN